MSYALFLLAFLATSQGSLQAGFATFPNQALHRRHLIHERQAPCFNDLNTGQPQSCIASASCCRGVQFSTCVMNGMVCCDFGDSMGSCPAGYQCLKNASGEPSCQPPNGGGGGGGGGGSDETETEESSTTSEEVDSMTTSEEDSSTTSFFDSSTSSYETTTTSSDITTSSSYFYSSYTTTSSEVYSTSYNPFEQSTTIVEQSEVASPTATHTDGVTEQDSGTSTLTKAKIAGVIVSAVAALCGIIFGIVKLIMKHQKHKKEAAERRLLY